MNRFITGQHLLAFPELKRFVLVNTDTNSEHLVTDEMLRESFSKANEYERVITNRNRAWFVYEYYE